MRLHVRMLACAVALASMGCSGAQQQEFGRAEADAIRKQAQEFTAAYNAHDPAKVTSFYSGAAVLMPPNSSIVRGPDSIKGYFVARFADANPEITIEPKDMGGHGPLAYQSGTYANTIRPPGGKERRDRGKFLWILRNAGGRWRFEYQIWSSDLPPAAAE